MTMYRRLSMFTLLCGLLIAACGGTPPGATPVPTSENQTINGVVLPPDAAPVAQQVLVLHANIQSGLKAFDLFESVYTSPSTGPGVGNLFSDALVRTNKNFGVTPGAANKWSVDPSGLVWTFSLDPNLVWSDDTPVTADDYVATFRYAADPAHNWDFTWFFNGVIKNWGEVVAGSMPLTDLGVRAVDAHTLQIETVTPAPYLPAMLIYSTPFQKKALETHGHGRYNMDPATSVSSGPFVLKEYVPDQYYILEANPKYRGTNKPFIQKIIARIADPTTDLAAYKNREIDFVPAASLSNADYEAIAQDPELSKDLHLTYGDFRSFYAFFDNQTAPFNNLKVRQAFSHVIDRKALVDTVIKPINGIAAYSYLMPGFPAADPDAYKAIQSYDIAQAKQLLAEAGYPEGKGFPPLTLTLRREPNTSEETMRGLGKLILDGLKQHLGIAAEVRYIADNNDFSAALNAKPTQIQFGVLSYGMDFLDPYNMLSVWLSGGRHNWQNSQFDQQVKQAASFTGDSNERVRMFQQAERLLVSDVGGIFLFHQTRADLYRPYLAGSELQPDDVGVAGIHSPGFNSFTQLPGSLYISKDVSRYRSSVPENPRRK